MNLNWLLPHNAPLLWAAINVVEFWVLMVIYRRFKLLPQPLPFWLRLMYWGLLVNNLLGFAVDVYWIFHP